MYINCEFMHSTNGSHINVKGSDGVCFCYCHRMLSGSKIKHADHERSRFDYHALD